MRNQWKSEVYLGKKAFLGASDDLVATEPPACSFWWSSISRSSVGNGIHKFTVDNWAKPLSNVCSMTAWDWESLEGIKKRMYN